MEHIYRKLVASFSEIKGFDGWMIAKAEFQVAESRPYSDGYIETENMKILRQRRNYSAVMSRMVYKGIEYMLVMHIVKPYGGSLAENSVLDSDGNYLFTLKYTKEDIRQFIHNSKDSNYIHQTDRPVVPGFLVFGDVLGKLFFAKVRGKGVGFETGNYTMSFRTPAFADETIDVFKIGNCEFKLILSGRGAVYGESIYSRRS